MKIKNTAIVKQISKQLGFDYCGIAKAELLSDDAKRLEQWLKKGLHGKMQYMENHFDKRIDPTKLVEGAKSVITLLLNYYPAEQQNEAAPKIAKYAFGKDYHEVIREKLHHFISLMNEQIGEIHGRGFIDSAPVLERTWAVKSGIGWLGKNGNLISKQNGSFFFIATLIVDIELEYDHPFVKDYCGTCTKCIDACPTEAILPNKVIDGSQCISYYTIELKEAIIDSKKDFNNWMFGCDVCQDVCPWNKFGKIHQENRFQPSTQLLDLTKGDWEDLDKETFQLLFKNSAVKRTKFEGLKRNISFLKK